MRNLFHPFANTFLIVCVKLLRQGPYACFKACQKGTSTISKQVSLGTVKSFPVDFLRSKTFFYQSEIIVHHPCLASGSRKMTNVSCPYYLKLLQKYNFTIFTNVQCKCEHNQKAVRVQVLVPTVVAIVTHENFREIRQCFSKRPVLLMNFIVSSIIPRFTITLRSLRP